MLASKSDTAAAPAPRAKAKWVTASVADDAAEVIARVFDEAERRDPGHKRRWVALVDGNCHQIERINVEAEQRKANVAVVLDLIHVREYPWEAVWCFFAAGDAAAEEWVRDRALAVLEGKATDVAAGIRRRATTAGLAKAKRKKADDCARYLINKADYLDYPAALAAGSRRPGRPRGSSGLAWSWPVAARRRRHRQAPAEATTGPMPARRKLRRPTPEMVIPAAKAQ